MGGVRFSPGKGDAPDPASAHLDIVTVDTTVKGELNHRLDEALHGGSAAGETAPVSDIVTQSSTTGLVADRPADDPGEVANPQSSRPG